MIAPAPTSSGWGHRRPSVSKRLLPILFMHVPKCAGWSVFSLIRELFEEHEICPLPLDGTWRARASEVPGYQLYCGHFSMDFIHELGRGTRLITLRDPVRRVVSLYDYWRSYRWEYITSALSHYPENGPATAKSCDFTGFLESKWGHDIYNFVGRQLLGRSCEVLLADEEAAIDRALAALQDFTWIGITEHFDASIAALADALGLPAIRSSPRLNQTYHRESDLATTFEPVTKTILTEAQRRRILEGNRIDCAIYRRGCELLHERISRMNGQDTAQNPVF
jgi:Sulfotransferase family